MSQYPPPPYQPQQPGYPPQGGYPPGGYPPQGMNYAPGTMPPSGSNGWGLASLITGLIGFCVPFLGGLLAILFGFIGVGRARKVRTGMGLSVAGIILGLLSLAAYALFGTAILALVQGTKVNRDIAKQFINDLTAGNISAAHAQVDTSISTADLEGVSQQLKSHGTITDITTFGINSQTNQANQTVALAGAITFSSGKVPFSMTQDKVNGQWKISGFQLNPGQPGGTSPPRTPTTAPNAE